MNCRLLPALAACLFVAGCLGHRDRLRQSPPIPPGPERDLRAAYVVRCPDVLEVRVNEQSGLYEIGLDGDLTLPTLTLRASGLTAPALAWRIARELRLPESAVDVRVAEYRSQNLYLVGDVTEERQVVAYQGPETVVDLLRRVGVNIGDLAAVRVVRAHVADGKPPEVFYVDLAAILHHRDPQTNIRLEPADHVHVSKREPFLAEYLPPVLTTFWGTKHETRR